MGRLHSTNVCASRQKKLLSLEQRRSPAADRVWRLGKMGAMLGGCKYRTFLSPSIFAHHRRSRRPHHGLLIWYARA